MLLQLSSILIVCVTEIYSLFSHWQGNVNGQDLVDLNARYLSLTKAQQIRTLMHFQNSVHFKRPVTVTSGNVSLYGDLVANER